jgi:hypothetical protein
MTLAQHDYADEEDSELLQTIKCQDWPAVQALLSSSSSNKEEELAKLPDRYDNLPLHVAIGYKAPSTIILELLQCYPEATRVHGTDDWLPLHIAAMWGVSAQVMEALILAYPQALGDPGEQGIKGRTPRHFSARFQHNTALLERSTEQWIKIKEAEENKVTSGSTSATNHNHPTP